MASIPTVVDIPDDTAVRGDQRSCSCGGNPQEKHCLAAQELSDAGAQHFATIRLPLKKSVVEMENSLFKLWK